MFTLSALSIGTLAAHAGVNVETIRFYQRKGLLQQPARPPRGARRYAPATVDRVRFIKSAQAWGFSLDDIAELLRLEDGAGCEDARRIAEARLAVVRSRLRDLRRMATALEAAVDACKGRRGRVSCPLTASLRLPQLRRPDQAG